MAQSHTPYDHCVRFVVVVAFHNATLVTGRALPLPGTGLSPAGPRQLRLAHRYAFTVRDSHPLLLAGLPAHFGFVSQKLASLELLRQPHANAPSGFGDKADSSAFEDDFERLFFI